MYKRGLNVYEFVLRIDQSLRHPAITAVVTHPLVVVAGTAAQYFCIRHNVGARWPFLGFV